MYCVHGDGLSAAEPLLVCRLVYGLSFPLTKIWDWRQVSAGQAGMICVGRCGG